MGHSEGNKAPRHTDHEEDTKSPRRRADEPDANEKGPSDTENNTNKPHEEEDGDASGRDVTSGVSRAGAPLAENRDDSDVGPKRVANYTVIGTSSHGRPNKQPLDGRKDTWKGFMVGEANSPGMKPPKPTFSEPTTPREEAPAVVAPPPPTET